MKIDILFPIEVSGHGALEPGPQDLPDWLAELLLERGYAVAVESPSPSHLAIYESHQEE